MSPLPSVVFLYFPTLYINTENIQAIKECVALNNTQYVVYIFIFQSSIFDASLHQSPCYTNTVALTYSRGVFRVIVLKNTSKEPSQHYTPCSMLHSGNYAFRNSLFALSTSKKDTIRIKTLV